MLTVLYVFMIFICLLLVMGMFLAKEEQQSVSFFVCLFIYTLLIGVIAFSNQPNGYFIQKFIIVAWCFLGGVSVIIRILRMDKQLPNFILLCTTIFNVIWIL